ncbi:multidrug resistance protein [Sphingomonas sp. DBB INV C78]|uniref:MFS transporter n=1 Tax=Sphingomonas sp. DBB INV C78 TaxID=3349434 RepID=UPI0036D3C499
MAALGLSGERRDFALLFLVMLTIAAGNTALQSVLPAIGRLLALPDTVVALTFSFSALVWALAAPGWARRSDRKGRKRMVLTGLAGFTLSLALCAVALTAGIAGWVTAMLAFAGFVAARMIYGFFGAAAPPAAQALVASRTSRAQRTAALTMLASAFGLGTILGPALAPFFVLPWVGLAGPAYVFALFGLVVLVAAYRLLPDDGAEAKVHGAATAEPSIGGEPSGASVIAALNEQTSQRLRWNDPRLMPWMVSGVIAGHAQAMAGQAMGFLVMDRLHLPPIAAQPVIGLVLMAGAAAALLAQWGIIPRLKLPPRAMVIWGALIAAAGCAMIAAASDVHGLAVAFALSSLGFGFLRPGFTAGASLAVGTREQGVVAGRVTSVNGAVFVLGPSIGIGLYQIAPPFPYLLAAVALLLNAVYAARRLRG